MTVKQYIAKYAGVTNSILIASIGALVLYLLRNIATGTPQFSFMAWNLVLSLAALLAATAALLALSNKKSKLGWLLLVVWLLLLPNTFYMLTDFIHVRESGDINILFDIVLIGFFAMNGFVHGLLSVFMVHTFFIRIYKKWYVHAAIGLIILASSFAVDMGRYLRWNSWYVITSPRSLLFDVSDAFINPSNYDRSFLITGVFFIAITSLYAVIWQLSKLQLRK